MALSAVACSPQPESSDGPPPPSVIRLAAGEAPTARNNTWFVDEDTPLTVDAADGVLANDLDPESDPLTAVLDTNVSHGTLTLGEDGAFTYTPAPDYNGLDAFTYHAHDGSGDSNVVTVTFRIVALNDAPIANDDAFVTPADTALVIEAPGVLANDTEPENEAMHVHDYDRESTAGGTVGMGENRGVSYTPPPGFNGLDTFTYTATDPNRFRDNGQGEEPTNSLGVSLGDLDGDGDLDAFVANGSNQPNRVWLNNGSGTFADSGQTLGSENSTGVSLGDLDGDGDLDAFVANGGNQPNRVWLNNGSGTFADSGQALGSSNSLGVSLGDLDGDGDLDAFVANYNQPNGVWLNNGSGTFADSGQAFGSSDSYGVSLGDLDGDGDLDAFVANYNQPNRVWLNAPSVSNRATVTLTVGTTNGPPVITSNGGGPTAAISAAENQTGVTTVTATDPENDPRTYSITGGADMARFSIVAGTGVLTFVAAPDFEVPTDADANNTYIVTVTATAMGGTDTQTLTVTVTNVNEEPTITSNGGGSTAAISAAESQTGVTTVTSTDPESDAQTYSITGGADLARFSIVAGTGVLTFVAAPDFEAPTDADANGTYVVTVTATDPGTLADTQTLTVTVTNVNEEPSFVQPTPAEGATVSISRSAGQELALAAMDVDANDTLVLTTPTAPAWLTLTDHADGTAALTVAPNDAAPGDYEVRVLATDTDGATAERTFTVRVTDTNAPPTVSLPTGPLAVDEGSQLLLTATASDPNGDALTLTWDLDDDGAFDDATGPEATFTAPDGPATVTVTVLATDSLSATATDTTTVTVANVAPVVHSLTGTFSGTAGTELAFQANATDPGPDALTITWDFGDGTDAQTDVDLTTTSHAWASGGDYTLTLTVTDDDGASTQTTHPVTIDDAQPSIVSLTGDTAGDEGSAFGFQALATDPTGGGLSNVWDFGDGSPPQSGVELAEVTHVYARDGRYTLTLTVSGPSGVAEATLSVEVANVPPQLVGDPQRMAHQGVPYHYRPAVLNPGAGALTFGLLGGPTGMAVAPLGAVTWTPSPAQAAQQPAEFEVTLVVLDAAGGGDTQTWTITVATAAPVDDETCGAPDACELQYGFDLSSCADDTADSDADGLTLATECAEGSDPTISNAPTAPIALTPHHNQLIAQQPVALLLHNAWDPDGDALTYAFELYDADDTELAAPLFTAANVPPGDRRTHTDVTTPLAEDTRYTWRARASDGRGTGPWSELAPFLRSTTNDPPTAPAPTEPTDRAVLASDQPLTLRWRNARDPEGHTLRYNLDLETVAEGTFALHRTDLTEAPDGTTTLRVEPLPPGAYLWRVQATDGDQPGPWSTRCDDSGEDVGADDVGVDVGDDAGDADLDAGTGDASDDTDPPPLASHGVNTTCGCATLDPRRSAMPLGTLLLGLLAMVGLVAGVRRRRAGAMES